MALRRAALTIAAAALALGAAGCSKEHKEPSREGLAVDVGGLDYNVYITRQLNLRDPEDRGYYNGPEPPPGSSFFGVFLQVCNTSEDGPARAAAEDFKVVDTQGEEFEPVEVPEDNAFAYHPRELGPQSCIPEAGSLAASSPTAGSLLIFELTNAAAENRPLELEIEGPLGGGEGEPRAVIELDI